MERIKQGWGFWETDHYPIGGCFRRAGSNCLIAETLRYIKPAYRGADREVLLEDGRKVAVGNRCIEEVLR
jgi:hypothetical protein